MMTIGERAGLLTLLVTSVVTGRIPAAEATPEIPEAIHQYMAKPESVYRWELLRKTSLGPGGTVYDLDLTSQEWQGHVWKHAMQVFEPSELKHPGHMLLFVTGGSIGNRPGPDNLVMGAKLAQLTGSRVATLHQVPNQPLFGGRKEDDLITETWLRYLETGDEKWPLLFPMVKSAVKAMDACQELARQEWRQEILGFVITGASKRGWTSWLTPVADSRIVATAPIVIDTLNFRAQMKHQLETWGKYSEQIADYTSKGLIKEGEESPREAHLRQMMDPYTYRQQLKLPKLLINGANDRYWSVDATRFYWDELVGPKYLLAVPNAGHGLDGGRDLAFATLATFYRHAITDRPLPELTWKHADAEGDFVLKIRSSAAPQGARMWVVRSSDKDFRDDRWEPQPLQRQEDSFLGRVTRPAQGHVALFGELQFQEDGVPYSLCTLIRAE